MLEDLSTWQVVALVYVAVGIPLLLLICRGISFGMGNEENRED